MEEYIKNLIRLVENADEKELGLFTGTMGISFSLYIINKSINDVRIEQLADLFLEKTVGQIAAMKDISFDRGLSGIGWAINYLHMLHCVEGDVDDILYNIDALIYKKLCALENRFCTDFPEGLLGYLVYLIYRFKNKCRKKDGQQNQINEASLRIIIDKMEDQMLDKFQMMTKDKHTTILWDFPILFYCLGKAMELGIYKEKINSLIANWSFYFTGYLPYFNINRLALANTLAYANTCIGNMAIKSYIDTLFYSINFEKYICEIDKKSIILNGDWFYAILHSSMAMYLMDREHVRYPELENIHKRMLYLYKNDFTEAICNIGEVQPDTAFINGYSGALLSYCLIDIFFTNEDIKILI